VASGDVASGDVAGGDVSGGGAAPGTCPPPDADRRLGLDVMRITTLHLDRGHHQSPGVPCRDQTSFRERTGSVPFRFSTDDVPERDRHARWAETMHSVLGLQAQPLADASGPFRANLSVRTSGPLGNLSLEADAHLVARRAGDSARRKSGSYCIYHQASAGAWFRRAGGDFVTRVGDLIISDSDAPFEAQPFGHHRLDLWSVPKALLDPHLPASGRSLPLSMKLSGRNGVDALAAGYLETLTQRWDSISADAMESVADTLCRLIGLACGTTAEEQAGAVQTGRLVEAKRHIDRHLADPDLTPTSVAGALRTSVRALHKLFEPTGVTFARHVQRRRLEECRTALLANPVRPVIDIAFAWGFGSMSGFYQAFQAHFDMSPGDLRAAPRNERPAPPARNGMRCCAQPETA
jgi:AraC-like DNA-binding protein